MFAHNIAISLDHAAKAGGAEYNFWNSSPQFPLFNSKTSYFKNSAELLSPKHGILLWNSCSFILKVFRLPISPTGSLCFKLYHLLILHGLEQAQHEAIYRLVSHMWTSMAETAPLTFLLPVTRNSYFNSSEVGSDLVLIRVMCFDSTEYMKLYTETSVCEHNGQIFSSRAIL